MIICFHAIKLHNAWSSSKKYISVIVYMSALNGHETYSDIIRSKINNNDGNGDVFFEPNSFEKMFWIKC